VYRENITSPNELGGHMAMLLDKKKRAKRKAVKYVQERMRQSEDERKRILENEFHHQRNEPITVIEIFNIISTVLNDTDRYRIQEELKGLLIRRA
jgi:hypothetical protein